MERKNDNTIFLLIAAGLGIYWLTKKKSMPPATTLAVSTSIPKTTMPIDQNPTPLTPLKENITIDETISTQPIYEQPISVQPVYEQPTTETPVTEMFNSMLYSGGNKAKDKYK
jgi:hypothetical protein